MNKPIVFSLFCFTLLTSIPSFSCCYSHFAIFHKVPIFFYYIPFNCTTARFPQSFRCFFAFYYLNLFCPCFLLILLHLSSFKFLLVLLLLFFDIWIERVLLCLHTLKLPLTNFHMHCIYIRSARHLKACAHNLSWSLLKLCCFLFFLLSLYCISRASVDLYIGFTDLR